MSSRPSRGAARLAAILDALPDALVLVNANGTVVNANTIALEAFETPGTALVGRGLLDLLPQFDSKLIPGSMRRPDHIDPRARTRPTRMIARRTDGTEFPVEVTSANLENGQQAYDSYGYTGDELLMLVVRDLSGTVDTEAELARSQRQTEMILRAASEGVVGTDTDGRIVLVNPAAAQILGFRASDLGGRELHTLVLHSRADGSPFPYGESPLADTLRSGRKHRVRGQVLYAKDGSKVPVDLTTAPVRDGDQLVGAVMTFTDRRPYDAVVEEKEAAQEAHAEELERVAEEHASELTALRQKHVAELEQLREEHAEELAAGEDRYAALGEREKDRYEALAARHEQLLTLLGRSLRGPLEELRRDLATLAADDAGQLWPEANQVLHHLSAGYSRITTLIDNVLGYQRLDTGAEVLARTKVMLDAVVASGVDGAVELIGPGRVQFAVHAPPIEAEVDPRLLATALAHLVADVAGVDSTGNAPVSTGGYMDNTVVVAAAQRGAVVRIEVRGPYAGGDPVHQPIVQGIVRAHGGVLQTHEVPGMSGNAYVLEVPIGGGAGAVAAPAAGRMPALEQAPGPAPAEARVEARAQVEAPAPAAIPAPASDSGEGAAAAGQGSGGGRRRARRSSVDAFLDGGAQGAGTPEEAGPENASGSGTGAGGAAPTGRRRRRAVEAAPGQAGATGAGAVPESGSESGVASGSASGAVSGGTGRRRGRPAEDAGAVGAVGAAGGAGPPGAVAGGGAAAEGAVRTAAEHAAGTAATGNGLGGTVPPRGVPAPVAPTGRRARRDNGEQHALPPALPAPSGEHALGGANASSGSEASQPTGRRRRALAAANERAAAQEAGPRTVFALPPAEADRATGPGAGHAGQSGTAPRVPGAGNEQTVPHPPVPGAGPGGRTQVPRPGPSPAAPAASASAGDVPVDGRQDAVSHDPSDGHTPPPAHAAGTPAGGPTGRRRRAAQPTDGAAAQGTAGHGVPVQVQPGVAGQGGGSVPVPQQGAAGPASGQPVPGRPVPVQGTAPQPGTSGHPIPLPLPPRVSPGQTGAGQSGAGQAGAGQAGMGQAGAGQAGVGQPVPGQAPHAQGALAPAPAPGTPAHGTSGPGVPVGQPLPAEVPPGPGTPVQGTPVPQQWPDPNSAPGAGTPVHPHGHAPVPPHGTGPVPPQGTGSVPPAAVPGVPGEDAPPHAQPALAPGAPLPPESAAPHRPEQPGRPGQPARLAQPLPLPAEAATPAPAPLDPNSTQGRAISVRTLGQGVPFTRQAAQVQQPQAHTQHQTQTQTQVQTQPHPQPQTQASTALAPHQPGAAARRRKLGTPQTASASAAPTGQSPSSVSSPSPSRAGQRPAPGGEDAGRSYAIGAPDENAAEGPEPLDGPGGAVEVAEPPRPQPMDDELPPEPLDNPRRLLVWPAPDVPTQQALSDRGYRPVVVHSREEVDAQIAAFPAALFVDPLTGPITRTALQSLRQAAVAAEVPVLVTAGLGQASRDAAYGADPAVLLKALAPRDSEQHPPRVLLIEEHAEIALALTATLERRGMQVARAASDQDGVTLASQFRPNLVVMDLMRVHPHQAGIIDWLRANGQLNRTPLVVYTATVDPADRPRLASGETVLFLAERSTTAEAQARIVDVLARVGTN